MQPAAFPPGPPPRRGGPIGNLAYGLRFVRDPIGFIGGRFRRYGDIYYAPGPDGGLYVLKHPDHIREVLATRSHCFAKKHSAFEQLSMVMGDGLLTTDGEVWKRQRRLVQPAFTKRALASYAAAMAAEAEETAGRWRGGEERDMSAELMEMTLRIVARTLFSHDVRGDTDDVRRAMREFQEVLAGPSLTPSWLPSRQRRRLTDAVAALDEMIYRVVAERRAVDPEAAPDDLLQRLISAVDEEDGGGMTEKEVRDQLVTLYLAGHETTSHALTWTLYLLSQNRDAERRLHRELDQVLGDRAPTLDDLDRLPWTDQVFKEGMRLYPPAFIVTRKAIADTEIGGYPVSAGAEVAIWIYMTHRDPRWFPKPGEFRPERFDPGRVAALPKMAYLPFGGGPRACIGAGFASIEARLILASLARRFSFALAPGQRVDVKPRITLVPKYGMRMQLRSR